MTQPRRVQIKAGHYRTESGEYVAAVTVTPLPNEAAASALAPLLQHFVYDGLARIEAAGLTRKA